uniref:Structural protein n=1 Tax=Rice ragged stunt virus TaxID=42475 RepID=A0A7L5KTW3_RRSV|nr:structural protein [Rice ragged stunt virus]
MNTKGFAQKIQRTFHLIHQSHYTPPPNKISTHVEIFSELLTYVDYEWQRAAIGASRWVELAVEENEIHIPFNTKDERQVNFLIAIIHVAISLYSNSGVEPFADCDLEKILNGDYESSKFDWNVVFDIVLPNDVRLKEKTLKAAVVEEERVEPRPKRREITLGGQRPLQTRDVRSDSDLIVLSKLEAYDDVVERTRQNNTDIIIHRLGLAKMNPTSNSILPAKISRIITEQVFGAGVNVDYIARPTEGFISLSTATYTVASYFERGIANYDINAVLDNIIDKTDQLNTTDTVVELPSIPPEDSSIEVATPSHETFFDINTMIYIIMCCGSITNPMIQRLNGIVTRYNTTNYVVSYPDTDDGRKKALAERAVITVDGKYYKCYNDIKADTDKRRILNPAVIKEVMISLRHYCGSVIHYRERMEATHISQVFCLLMGICYGGLDTKKIRCRWFEWPAVSNVPVTSSYAEFKGSNSGLPPYQCRKFTPRTVMTSFAHWNLWAWMLDLAIDKSMSSDRHLSIMKIYVLNAFSHLVLNSSLENSANILGPFPSFSGYTAFTSTSIVRDVSSCQRLAPFLLRMFGLVDYVAAAASSEASGSGV